MLTRGIWNDNCPGGTRRYAGGGTRNAAAAYHRPAPQRDTADHAHDLLRERPQRLTGMPHLGRFRPATSDSGLRRLNPLPPLPRNPQPRPTRCWGHKTFRNESLTGRNESNLIDHVPAFGAWPAAPNAGPKTSVFQLFRAVAAVFRRFFSHAFAHVSAADQGAEISWQKRVVNLYLVFRTDADH